MAEQDSTTAQADALTSLLSLPLQLGQQIMAQMLTPVTQFEPDAAAQWADIAARAQAQMQAVWGAYPAPDAALPEMPTAFTQLLESWAQAIPMVDPQSQATLIARSTALWEGVLAQWGVSEAPKADEAPALPPSALPLSDRRFADPAWRETPYFTLVHQTYLILAEQITAMTDRVEGLDPARKEQLRFMTRTMLDALSPDHFPLTNPLVMEKALETGGESLTKGMDHLLHDLSHGQLTHTNAQAFTVGENVAATPGKVVLRTPMFELIHYTPTTEKVDATPLLIFPPWINRFYILDLNPKKSFVKWALDQGLSVFLVSWKSADASMAEVVWDDYIAAQVEAIEAVRARLKVPAVHTIGYCVAGTTLAATLAILARRGEADKVASATFFTAQVDFERAGELKNFIDDQQLATLAALAPEGYVDGRYLAATFNLLRGRDLIWNYVVNNYLLGQDYPAFDLLFWNGDTTNLPAKWHQDYLRDLYRDNLLVRPDAMVACDTPIDLGQIVTPCYIQAGREDHIAPPESVWRMTEHLGRAPHQFVLAGSGHIAGVVNPPAAHKYQYWTCDGAAASLDDFVAQAKETPGSWWPHWLGWLRGLAGEQVSAKGKRVPGGRGDKVICDAPGDYVRMR